MNLIRTSASLAILVIGAEWLLAAEKLVSPVANTQPTPDAAETNIQMFPLLNARCKQACGIISSVIDDVRCTYDERTNTVIVSGEPGRMKRVEPLILQLDYRKMDRPAPRIVRLQRPYRDDFIARLIATAGIQPPYLFDPVSNQLVIRTTEDEFRTVAQILSAMDKQVAPTSRPEASAPSVRARLVWLARTPGRAGAPAEISRDIQPVIEELARIGTPDLTVATQSIVQTTAGNCSFTMTVRGRELKLTCNAVQGQPGSYAVQLVVHDTGSSQSTPAEHIEVQTTVNAPPGRPVVLAASMESAFVLQFLMQ